MSLDKIIKQMPPGWEWSLQTYGGDEYLASGRVDPFTPRVGPKSRIYQITLSVRGDTPSEAMKKLVDSARKAERNFARRESTGG